MSRFYDVGALGEVATNLFHGWGYDFYRSENQLRADDQLIRSKVGQILGFAHADVAAAETAYRRAFPPPSRAQPFPDPAAIAGAQALERVGRELAALIGRVQSQPVPANDRMTQRYRDEADTLAYLRDHDRVLVGQAALLRTMIEGQPAAALLERLADLDAGIAALRRTLEDRASALASATRA